MMISPHDPSGVGAGDDGYVPLAQVPHRYKGFAGRYRFTGLFEGGSPSAHCRMNDEYLGHHMRWAHDRGSEMAVTNHSEFRSNAEDAVDVEFNVRLGQPRVATGLGEDCELLAL